YVAFESYGNNFGPPDSNGREDIYVRDRVGGSNILVSVNLAGTSGGNGNSYEPRISADGRYVLFLSDASDLVTNADNNANSDVFVRDLVLGTTRLVSVNRFGNATGNGASYYAVMTPDGRHVAFDSEASDLVPNDVNGDWLDIFVRDLVAHT